MPGARKSKKGQTERGKNSEQKPTEMWDKKSVQEFDGRENRQAGSKGTEPGGRWSKAYYESPAAVISRDNVRKV